MFDFEIAGTSSFIFHLFELGLKEKIFCHTAEPPEYGALKA